MIKQRKEGEQDKGSTVMAVSNREEEDFIKLRVGSRESSVINMAENPRIEAGMSNWVGVPLYRTKLPGVEAVWTERQ
jgi:hypothetical protein